MDKVPYVIYHANCADGFGAAFAAWMKFGDNAYYIPMHYIQQWSDTDAVKLEDMHGRDVYILDFSFSNEMMDDIMGVADEVVWLDHHKTAFDNWAHGIPEGGIFHDTDVGLEIILDNNRSGALIAWQYFHPDTTVPRMIQHIDDYDRWQFKLDYTKEFNKGLWSHAPWSFTQWKAFQHDCSGLIAQGTDILRAHKQQVESIAKYGLPITITGPQGKFTVSGKAVNCSPSFTSDVGHELAVQSGTFGMCWVLSTPTIARCSLRSNDDYDVSLIAKLFGGGGHKNAAGFEVDIHKLLEWLQVAPDVQGC